MASIRGAWGRFLARTNDDPVKIFGVATLVALAASVVVSLTSVLLEPRQAAHLAAERAARMEAMLDALPGLRDLMLAAGVDTLETRMVDLSDGSFAPGTDPAGYDLAAAAADPETGVALPPEADIAGLKRRAPLAPVYLLQKDGDLALLVLPVRGVGYQSTIEAMLALEGDLRTIAALSIVAQGETPGIGARIEEAEWQAKWPGTRLAGPDGTIAVEVVRGEATEPWQVDGISGATRTGNGITNMLRFWLGPWGYGPFLERLEREGL
jgi:Na+-transporting NADH:ubiquinone oxidoreductase subunit C